MCSGPVGVEGGLSWGGDETPPLLPLWLCWLALRKSSSLKLLPEFCLKKPGLEVCMHKYTLIHFLNCVNVVMVKHYVRFALQEPSKFRHREKRALTAGSTGSPTLCPHRGSPWTSLSKDHIIMKTSTTT